jgi:hypothetical protein
MELTITIPTSATVTAESFLDQAARGYGWHPDQGISAEEAILDGLEHELHARYRSARGAAARAAVEVDLPIPESRGLKVAREREEERVAEERERQAQRLEEMALTEAAERVRGGGAA